MHVCSISAVMTSWEVARAIFGELIPVQVSERLIFHVVFVDFYLKGFKRERLIALAIGSFGAATVLES